MGKIFVVCSMKTHSVFIGPIVFNTSNPSVKHHMKVKTLTIIRVYIFKHDTSVSSLPECNPYSHSFPLSLPPLSGYTRNRTVKTLASFPGSLPAVAVVVALLGLNDLCGPAVGGVDGFRIARVVRAVECENGDGAFRDALGILAREGVHVVEVIESSDAHARFVGCVLESPGRDSVGDGLQVVLAVDGDGLVLGPGHEKNKAISALDDHSAETAENRSDDVGIDVRHCDTLFFLDTDRETRSPYALPGGGLLGIEPSQENYSFPRPVSASRSTLKPTFKAPMFSVLGWY